MGGRRVASRRITTTHPSTRITHTTASNDTNRFVAVDAAYRFSTPPATASPTPPANATARPPPVRRRRPPPPPGHWRPPGSAMAGSGRRGRRWRAPERGGPSRPVAAILNLTRRRNNKCDKTIDTRIKQQQQQQQQQKNINEINSIENGRDDASGARSPRRREATTSTRQPRGFHSNGPTWKETPRATTATTATTSATTSATTTEKYQVRHGIDGANAYPQNL